MPYFRRFATRLFANAIIAKSWELISSPLPDILSSHEFKTHPLPIYRVL